MQMGSGWRVIYCDEAVGRGRGGAVAENADTQVCSYRSRCAASLKPCINVEWRNR